jgi:putative hydrolase of the HAD superfamily
MPIHNDGMIRLIIFDIGDVLEHFNEEMYISYICHKLHINMRDFTDYFLRLLERAEAERMTNREMLGRISKRFGVSVSSLEWGSSLRRMARVNKNIVGLANALGRKYKVVLLSNVSRSRYLQNRRIELFRILRYDRLFASCYMHMRKPEHRIYRHVLREMRVRPEEAVFIDDRLENVQGADEVGINGIHFTCYGNLVMDLRELGVRW